MDWAQGPETGGCVCPSPHLHVSHMHTHPCERHGRLEKISAWLCFCYSHFPTPPYLFLSVGLMRGRGEGRSPQAQAQGSSHGSCPSLSPGQSSPSEG